MQVADELVAEFDELRQPDVKDVRVHTNHACFRPTACVKRTGATISMACRRRELDQGNLAALTHAAAPVLERMHSLSSVRVFS